MPAGMDAAGFVAAAEAAFEAARARSGAPERWFRVAGRLVRLRLAGEALLGSLTRALSHLAAAPGGQADLTLDAWDSATTGVMMPPPIWSIDNLPISGEVSALSAPRRYAYFDRGASLLNLLDTERNWGMLWLRDAASLPGYEAAAPLRTLISQWFSGQGLAPAHAAAVGVPGAGALLAGPGGAGKSNTALAMLGTPLSYLSDDYCLLQAAPAPTAHSLYSSGKTHGRDQQRHPLLAGKAANPRRPQADKAIYFLHEHFPEKVVTALPLRAVLLVRVDAAHSARLTPLAPAAAARAIIPGTLALFPWLPAEAARTLLAVTRSLPCYQLDVGGEPGPIAAAIMSLLAAPGAPAGHAPGRSPARR